jgi:hypothetical protein
MICTECGKEIRPVVAVDIDGTLGRYHEHFVWFAEQYMGQKLPHDFAGDGEFSDHLGLDKDLYRDIKLAYRQGGMKRSMPMFSGAHRFMLDLHLRDIEVWIATTRPWMRLDNIDPDTQEWLTRHHVPYDYMIYGHDKYDQLVKRVGVSRIIGVVDDLFEQCEQAALATGVPGVAMQPARDHNIRRRYEPAFPNFVAAFNRVIHAEERWRNTYEELDHRDDGRFDRPPPLGEDEEEEGRHVHRDDA